MRGTIKWFNNSKGYGFVGREDGPDVFVHYTEIVGEGYRTLKEGDGVYFEVVEGTKGPQAINVVKIQETWFCRDSRRTFRCCRPGTVVKNGG